MAFQVFDLERHPGPVEERLDRIDILLSQLVSSGKGTGMNGNAHPGPMPEQKVYRDASEGGYQDGVGSEGYTREPGHSLNLPNNAHGQHTPFTHGAAGAGRRTHLDERA